MCKVIVDQFVFKYDIVIWIDQQILVKLINEYIYLEGLFFFDIYFFVKGVSDMQVYKQVFVFMSKKFNEVWVWCDLLLLYCMFYEVLIMVFIVEKEIGQKFECGMVVGVFVNCLCIGMLLQIDLIVIYGMGDCYQGKICKVDLFIDIFYNIYMCVGLLFMLIVLFGVVLLVVVLNLDKIEVLYFVVCGDGISYFFSNLNEYNQVVNCYQC